MLDQEHPQLVHAHDWPAWMPPPAHKVPGLDAHRIHGRLFVGSAPPKNVYRLGFETVVLAAEEWQPRSTSFEGPLRVIHCPLPDGRLTKSEREAAWEASRLVAKAIKRGDHVLVTCAMGRNRSAFIAALALHRITGRPGAWCANVVRERRRDRDGIPALQNSHFVELLMRL
jgi:hypothetical protein